MEHRVAGTGPTRMGTPESRFNSSVTLEQGDEEQTAKTRQCVYTVCGAEG